MVATIEKTVNTIASFVVQQEDLLEVLNVCNYAIAKSNSHPILVNYLVRIEKSKVTFTAFNLNLCVERELNCRFVDDGSFEGCIPSEFFKNVIASMPKVELEIAFLKEKDSVECIVQAGSAKIGIRCRSSADFPELPEIPALSPSLELDSALFQALLSTKVAASDDETKGILQGINFLFDGSYVIARACDGGMLASMQTMANVKAESFTLHAEDMKAVLKAIDDVPSVTISTSTACVELLVGSTRFICRSLQGSYPPVERLVPTEKDFKAVATVDAVALKSALKLVSLAVSNNEMRPLYLDVTANSVELSVRPSEIGTAQESIACSLKGEVMKPYIPAKQAIAALDFLGCKEVEICIESVAKPIVFRARNSIEDKTFLVMPMDLSKLQEKVG